VLSLIAYLALPQTARKITLDLPFQTLDGVVKTLASQTGQPLSVAPNLAREMVRVRVRNVSLNELLPRIAQCAHAEWTAANGRVRLERSPAMEAKLAKAERQWVAERLREDTEATLKEHFTAPYDGTQSAQTLRRKVDEWVSRHDPNNPFGSIPRSDWTMRRSLTAGLPGNRATEQLATTLDFDALAAMPHRGALNFSTAPRGEERPFSPAAMAVIREFQRNLAVYADALAGWDAQDAVVAGGSASRMTLHVGAVRTASGGPSFQLRFHAYDAQGKEVSIGTAYLMVHDPRDRTPPAPAERLKLTPKTIAIESAYDSSRRERAQGFSAEVREALRHPERFPRLAFQWSEVVPALAAKEDANVVANVSDSLEPFPLLQTGKDGSVDLASARRYLKYHHETMEEGPWMVVRPAMPGPAGVYRADRTRVAAIVRAMVDGLPISIEEAAAIPPRERSSNLLHSHPLVRDLPPFDNPAQASLLSSPEALEIVAALPPTSRSTLLRKGGEIAWANLGPQIQNLLYQSLLVTSPDTPALKEGQAAEAMAFEFDGDGNPKPRVEPLGAVHRRYLESLFPHELEQNPVSSDLVSRETLRQVSIRFEVSLTPTLLRRSAKGGPIELLGVHEIDFDVIPRREKSEMEVVYEGDFPSSDDFRFRPAYERHVQVKIKLPGGRVVEHQLQDWSFDPKAPFIKHTQLPTAHIRAIQEARDVDE
jgi:hypothetical protein